MTDDNGWGEYRMLVLKELERLSDSVSSMDSRMASMQMDLATHKVKAGLWGMIAGAVPGAIAAAAVWLSQRDKH